MNEESVFLAEGPSVDDECARLNALRSLDILDSAPEACYDTITRLAAEYMQCEVASLSFVDETRVWVKSSWGSSLREFPRAGSISNQIIGLGQPVVIPDMSVDLHSLDGLSILHGLGVRFYAGIPVCLAGGPVVGVLALGGMSPRPGVSPTQMRMLDGLAAWIADLLELRRLRMAATTDGVGDESAKSRLLANIRKRNEEPAEPWPTAQDLRNALERKEFVLYYQPEIDLVSRRIMGVEALIRWKHPERGLVPPMEFIPAAEANGMILPIGDWGMGEACRQIQVWAKRWPEMSKLRVCVNLSARQFSRTGLTDYVKSLLQQTGIEGGQLGLEMTESSLIPNMHAAVDVLGGLRALGIALYMDDFGTGYSSLSHLHRFPFDNLKIDRSFVQRMHEGKQPLQIVQTILELARVLGMEVVAEGIETEEQLRTLQEMGCRYGQGFLFSPAVPAEQIGELFVHSETIPGEGLDSEAS